MSTNTAMATMGTTTMTEGLVDKSLGEAGLYRLMTWLSPGYPVGAFSYSHGLEYAVEDGTVTDAAALRVWLADLLRYGSGRNDAILFRHAHDAAGEAALRPAALAAIAELAAAFAASSERHLETTAQGRAFAEATMDAWPCDALDRLLTAWDGLLAYPVVVAVAAAGHGLALAPSLNAYLHGFAGNLVSAGVRLIPLGQRAGQQVVAALEPAVVETAAAALVTPLEDLGGSALLADLAAMKHETQYTRLFRS
ncbi:urease accessory UreF family protein [Pelagibius sp. 7325]|uniref:urease accessory protein UreF n=1 Tax=Pelagibius sp. 7325 TaxID=3131994 RepID=UPI0030EB1886